MLLDDIVSAVYPLGPGKTENKQKSLTVERILEGDDEWSFYLCTLISGAQGLRIGLPVWFKGHGATFELFPDLLSIPIAAADWRAAAIEVCRREPWMKPKHIEESPKCSSCGRWLKTVDATDRHIPRILDGLVLEESVRRYVSTNFPRCYADAPNRLRGDQWCAYDFTINLPIRQKTFKVDVTRSAGIAKPSADFHWYVKSSDKADSTIVLGYRNGREDKASTSTDQLRPIDPFIVTMSAEEEGIVSWKTA